MIALVRAHFFFCFFFSSRRRHTRLQGDWSSDVCSSDLFEIHLLPGGRERRQRLGLLVHLGLHARQQGVGALHLQQLVERSEERRVGKECRSRWSPYH